MNRAGVFYVLCFHRILCWHTPFHVQFRLFPLNIFCKRLQGIILELCNGSLTLETNSPCRTPCTFIKTKTNQKTQACFRPRSLPEILHPGLETIDSSEICGKLPRLHWRTNSSLVMILHTKFVSVWNNIMSALCTSLRTIVKLQSTRSQPCPN